MQKRFLTCVVVFSLSQAALGGITFNFNYTDPIGQGFNAAGSTGMERRDALELAAMNFATAFSSYTAMIDMDVDGTATGSTLAAAGDAGGTSFSPGFGLNEVIRNKVLNSTDPNLGAADGTVTVNFAIPWELDINGTVNPPGPGEEFDWYSTMYHEFAHAFGFSSAIQTDMSGMNATDAWGTVGANNGEFGAFDQFLTNNLGASVFDSGSDLNEATYESLLTGGDSPSAGLFFNGSNATAANASLPVGLYSPTTYEEGSSGSHLDDNNLALAGSMMLAATGAGPSARTFSNIELGIFKDIGYSNVTQISPIPEPSSFLFLGIIALMLTGGRLHSLVRSGQAT